MRIGKDIMQNILNYLDNYMVYRNFYITDSYLYIFGCPIEIEEYNPMCLEVLLVESVPIYRESEV